MKKLVSFCVAFLLLLCVVPRGSCYEIGDAYQPDLTNLIANGEKRQYVQMMTDYYIRTDPAVQKTLEEGYTALFFFEGCSDHMDDPAFADLTYFRITAVCVAVRLNQAGIPYVTYFSDSCSTIPDRPLEYGAWRLPKVGDVGPATIRDGTYELYSVKHMGKYEALHVRESDTDGSIPAVYMIPDGFVTSEATEINIHTRTSNHTSGTNSMWSAGCILVGGGDFPEFTEMMDAVYYAVYDFFEVGQKVGTITINRQNLREEMYDLYEERDAVDMLLAATRRSLPHNYLKQCSEKITYQKGKTMRLAMDAQLMTLPCSNAVDARSQPVVTLAEKDELVLIGEICNGAGNLWYETFYEGQTCYIYSGHVEELSWLIRLYRNLFG